MCSLGPHSRRHRRGVPSPSDERIAKLAQACLCLEALTISAVLSLVAA
jgi:hypothetical protein